jgi:hypothetical protein
MGEDRRGVTDGSADLTAVFRAAELGRWPAPDGSILAVPPVAGAVAAVVAFTAHVLVAADVTQDWIDEQIPDGDLCAPLNPPFLAALTARTGTRVNNVDAFFLATVDRSGPDVSWLTETDAREHPRVRRALRYRKDVRVFACDSGFVTSATASPAVRNCPTRSTRVVRARVSAAAWPSRRVAWQCSKTRRARTCGRRSLRGTRPRCGR